jgi:RNA polymerase sigma factor (TIGR02999 family)
MQRDITLLLRDAAAGDAKSGAELLPLVYDELRRLAAAQMSRLRPGQTLQATALVHEAWVKLVGGADPGWEGRRHFFGAAANAMREIVVDHVRWKTAQKRGGGQAHVELDTSGLDAVAVLPVDDVLAIDAAVSALERDHPRKAQVVVMRFFGGFSTEEIAEALGLTTRTVEREWRFARAFLHAKLSA